MILTAPVVTTLAIFFIIQVVASVWWASKMNTLLIVLQVETKEVLAELKAIRQTYVSKTDFTVKCTRIEGEQKKMWEKIDMFQKI